MEGEKKVVLVTGGTGLVGQAIRMVVSQEQNTHSEEFVFISSKDADLA